MWLSSLETDMTKEKNFKKAIRARMAVTGEKYVAARRNLESRKAKAVPLAAPSAPPQPETWYEQCVREWRDAIHAMNGERWSDPQEMVAALRLASDAPNHKLLPEGGGLDLTGATLSHEPGCVELHCGGAVDILRPSELTLHRFGNDPLDEWAFLWLELTELAPSGVYPTHVFRHEELTEVRPGEYVGREHWDHGALEDGTPLPSSARVVTRRFDGSVLIVTKGAGWNTVDDYFGAHNKMGRAAFIARIADLIEQLRQAGNYGKPTNEWIR